MKTINRTRAAITKPTKNCNSQKHGCPATIQICGIKVHKDYHVNKSLFPNANALKMAKKKDVLKKLKSDLISNASLLSPNIM